jgi:4-hydroxybenzoate polyprenyltransferase
MNNPDSSRTSFWLGNALLVVALVMLLFMNPIAERIGSLAFVLWAVLAGAGVYLIMKDKRQEPPL